MRYQAEHADDADDDREEGASLKEFMSVMCNDAVAKQEVLKFTQDNPADRKYAKKGLLDWSAFRRRHGLRKSIVDDDRVKPMTEAAFTIRCINKLGLKQADAEAWWSEIEADPKIDRDDAGYKGATQ
eukprot:10064761-Alexandrium_andersonii.AAC.1